MFFFGEIYKVQIVLQNLHPFFIYLFRDKKFQYFSFSVFTKTKKIYFIKNFVTLVNFVSTRPIFKKNSDLVTQIAMQIAQKWQNILCQKSP